MVKIPDMHVEIKWIDIPEVGENSMMIRHGGGQIISELLSCVGRDPRDLQIQKKVQSRFGTANKLNRDTKATYFCRTNYSPPTTEWP
jgi:hypothetical protein